jgi:predicted esterase
MMKSMYVVVSTLLFLCSASLAAPETGLNVNVPIDIKLFKTTTDYFKAKVPKKIYRAYKDGKAPSHWKDNGLSPEECVDYKPDEQTTVVYVPSAYDGTTAYGVYVHISPGARGISPSKDWQTLMDRMKMIYVSPNKTQNQSPCWRRVVLAMDSLATVKTHYKINDKRVYVGGLSGGGHMGMMCQMLYPEHFQGAISHAAQSYLPSNRENDFGHFPGLSLTDAKSEVRKDRKWAVISGSKDQNYKIIQETGKAWKAAKFLYTFFDVKDMGHENAPAEALEQAFVWMGADQEPKKTGLSKMK